MKRILLLATVLAVALALVSCEAMAPIHIFDSNGVCRLCGTTKNASPDNNDTDDTLKDESDTGTSGETDSAAKDESNNDSSGETSTVYHTLTLLDGFGNVIGTKSVADGSVADSIGAPTKDGYSFVGWYCSDGSEWEKESTKPVTADITLNAVWSCTISYNLSDSVNSDKNPTVIYSTTALPIQLESPSRESGRFIGWYTDSDFKNEITAIDNFAPLTLYAKWEDEIVDYTIKLQTEGGMPLVGIVVYVHKGEGYNIVSMPQVTDKNGMTTFSLSKSSDYSAQLTGIPNGYNVKSGSTKADRYSLTSSETEIILSSAPVTDGGYKGRYSLGDVMYDFTVTDVYGEEYTLSELLKDRDMVMLNFWFKNCYYCQIEFPHINNAYLSYRDSIEILAINDNAADTVDIIKAYPEYIGTDLQFPLIKSGYAETDLSPVNFGSNGYPTTVIIDRYGVVCAIIIGSAPYESFWNNLFEHFTADDYVQRLITDPNEFFY